VRWKKKLTSTWKKKRGKKEEKPLTRVGRRLGREVELQQRRVRLRHGRAQLPGRLVLVPAERRAVRDQQVDEVAAARADGLQESASAERVLEARVGASAQKGVDGGGVARAGGEHEARSLVIINYVNSAVKRGEGDWRNERKKKVSEETKKRKKRKNRDSRRRKEKNSKQTQTNTLHAVLQHVPQRVAVPRARGVQELRRPLLALVCGSADRKQEVDDGARADAHGLVERRRAPAVGDADVGAGLDKGLYGVENVLGGGDVERGTTVVVTAISPGSCF